MSRTYAVVISIVTALTAVASGALAGGAAAAGSEGSCASASSAGAGRLRRCVIGLSLAIAVLAVSAAPAAAVSHNIVISQVYGGGGLAGAPYTDDYIEIFNRGTTVLSVSGWSVQYASSTGTTWSSTPLTGVLPPGAYYLVQEASGGATGSPLPTPDAVGTTNLAASAGKVALVNNTGALAGACPVGGAIVDLVGYGTAGCFEGAGAAPAPGVVTADLRGTGGCTETDDNAADFTAAAPGPRNSASPANPCPDNPPVLDPIGDRSVDEGQTLTFTVSASDPDGDALAYSASNLPSGASFDPGTQTFSWTPDFSQSGSFPNVHFEVGDGTLDDSEDITITVNDVVIPPPVSTPAPSNLAPNPAPSNAFHLGGVKLNKEKGTATLTVAVPGPGSLVLSGKGLKKGRATPRRATGMACTERTVSASGAVTLAVRATGKTKRKLSETGKATVRVKVTYTPTNGTPSTSSQVLHLVKRGAGGPPRP